jgi:LAO/AO transport system kinase
MIAEEYISSIQNGDRGALSKAITLVESTKPEHRILAAEILDGCVNNSKQSIRIGVTGVPGVGKSTFINALGKYLVEDKHLKVAVLAVDPSSQQSGGSILGDKTRMEYLSISDNAFVRPSPSGDSLGGVAAATHECLMLCEAAGYDVILVETVGVGQSETYVYNMVDAFLLLLLPGAGDDLQGIKRGIVEMADVVAINKSDANPAFAKEAHIHYRNALQLIPSGRSGWRVPVQRIDSVTESGLTELWSTLMSFIEHQKSSSAFNQNRENQLSVWLSRYIDLELLRFIKNRSDLQELRNQVESQVVSGKSSVRSAAMRFVKQVLS